MSDSMKFSKKLTEEEYRSYPLESYSSLKSLLHSAEAFLKQQENPFLGNEFTDRGTAVHNLLQGFKITSIEEKVLPPHIQQLIKEQITDDLQLMLKGKYEMPFIGEYKGLKYKGKVDIITTLQIGEIKTSSKATDLKTFRKEAYIRDYDLQAAMYLNMTKRKKHYFIVVNTIDPYQVNCYASSETFINSGYLKLDKIVKSYNRMFNGDDEDEEV